MLMFFDIYNYIYFINFLTNFTIISKFYLFQLILRIITIFLSILLILLKNVTNTINFHNYLLTILEWILIHFLFWTLNCIKICSKIKKYLQKKFWHRFYFIRYRKIWFISRIVRILLVFYSFVFREMFKYIDWKYLIQWKTN